MWRHRGHKVCVPRSCILRHQHTCTNSCQAQWTWKALVGFIAVINTFSLTFCRSAWKFLSIFNLSSKCLFYSFTEILVERVKCQSPYKNYTVTKQKTSFSKLHVLLCTVPISTTITQTYNGSILFSTFYHYGYRMVANVIVTIIIPLRTMVYNLYSDIYLFRHLYFWTSLHLRSVLG